MQTPWSYKWRYTIQSGEFNPDKEKESVEIMPGIRVSKNDVGYADELIIISTVDGSYLILSTQGNPPSRKVLEEARDAIQHVLDEHCP